MIMRNTKIACGYFIKQDYMMSFFEDCPDSWELAFTVDIWCYELTREQRDLLPPFRDPVQSLYIDEHPYFVLTDAPLLVLPEHPDAGFLTANYFLVTRLVDIDPDALEELVEAVQETELDKKYRHGLGEVLQKGFDESRLIYKALPWAPNRRY
jgi:hypothetical protein